MAKGPARGMTGVSLSLPILTAASLIADRATLPLSRQLCVAFFGIVLFLSQCLLQEIFGPILALQRHCSRHALSRLSLD
jgi:hypothetical protein